MVAITTKTKMDPPTTIAQAARDTILLQTTIIAIDNNYRRKLLTHSLLRRLYLFEIFFFFINFLKQHPLLRSFNRCRSNQID